MTKGHAQIGLKSIKWQNIAFFMIFFNFEVILCKDLLVSGIDILHSCLYILGLIEYKHFAWFN